MNDLSGSTVVVIGGSSGIGLETARQAHAAGAKIVVTGRDRGRLDAARDELGASAARLDLSDGPGLHRFFAELPAPVDHVLVAGGGPLYSPIADMDFDEARSVLDEHLLGSLRIARECATCPSRWVADVHHRHARPPPRRGAEHRGHRGGESAGHHGERGPRTRPGPGQRDRRRVRRHPVVGAAARRELERRREELRATLPIRRVVGPSDVAALALHLMTNTALTGATYDIDGGQQLIP